MPGGEIYSGLDAERVGRVGVLVVLVDEDGSDDVAGGGVMLMLRDDVPPS